MAAQLMATNFFPARGLERWMLWAKISFPVPVSPTSMTGLFWGATRWASSAAERSFSLLPMTFSKV